MTRTPKSPQHAIEDPKLDEFLAEVPAHEKFLVAAGLPAAGSADFLRRWFTAWRHQHTDGIIGCCTDDVAFVDPGTGGVLRGARLLRDYTDRFFVAVPDLVFYPQGGTDVMPYWDFYRGQVRVTVPWRAVGRFSHTLALPEWPALAATGRDLNFVGIDRYVLTDDFRIARIDTDYDMVGILQQVGLIPDLLHPSMRAAVFVERQVAPLLRAFARA